MVKRRLKSGPAGATAVKPKGAEGGPEGEVVEEGGSFDGAVLSATRPGVTVKDAVVRSYPLLMISPTESYLTSALPRHGKSPPTTASPRPSSPACGTGPSQGSTPTGDASARG